jgi:hypothetical protein
MFRYDRMPGNVRPLGWLKCHPLFLCVLRDVFHCVYHNLVSTLGQGTWPEHVEEFHPARVTQVTGISL